MNLVKLSYIMALVVSEGLPMTVCCCLPQVSSWGGYVFLINIIPLHVLILMITGRFSHRVYVAYSTLYVIGTILSMQISFVGFQPVSTSEHMGVSACLLVEPPQSLLTLFSFLLCHVFKMPLNLAIAVVFAECDSFVYFAALCF